MRFLIFSSVCLCLSLAVGAGAQKPTPCESPPLMDGMLQLNHGLLTVSGRFTYDAEGKRIRLRLGVNGTNTGEIDLLMLFNEKVYYIIDESQFTCEKQGMDDEFIPIQVPPQSTLLRQAVLGTSSDPEMGLLVNTWAGMFSQEVNYMTTFTAIGCLPINVMYPEGAGWNFLNVFNIIPGIIDPMDFIPPSFCSEEVQQNAAEPEHFFTAVRSLLKNDQ